MSAPTNRPRWTRMIVLLAFAGAGGGASAAPAWYAAGVGGFDPNMPDFYQHQNWVFNGDTGGWESGKDRDGWCEFVADADVYYDLAKLGYKDLLSASITDPAKWFDTAYKPGDIANSDIAKLVAAEKGKSAQDYLDSTGHKVSDATAPLVAGAFKVKDDGTVTGTAMSAFDFVNEKLKAGDIVELNLLKGTTTPWWKDSFHQVAVAGLDIKNSTVFVADPDTNKGSSAAKAGWPDVKTFPGALASKAGDPIPIPAAPRIGTPDSYNANYAGFTLNDKNKVTGDADNARFTGTLVNKVETISAPKGKLSAITPIPGGVETTVAVNSGADTVDKVFLAPTTGLNRASGAVFSFAMAGSTWSAATSTVDPFGNPLTGGGVEYDLTSGPGLAPGQTATAMLGTTADFTTSGYEIFLHFAGDPATLWDPEIIGPAADSSIRLFQPDPQGVFEPASLLLLAIGGAVTAGVRRWRRAA